MLEIFSKNYRVRRNMIQSRLSQECGEDLSKQEVDKVLKVRLPAPPEAWGSCSRPGHRGCTVPTRGCPVTYPAACSVGTGAGYVQEDPPLPPVWPRFRSYLLSSLFPCCSHSPASNSVVKLWFTLCPADENISLCYPSHKAS